MARAVALASRDAGSRDRRRPVHEALASVYAGERRITTETVDLTNIASIEPLT